MRRRIESPVGASAATEVAPPSSPRKYWARRGIAHWLAERLAEDVPTIVGIPWLLYLRKQLGSRLHFWPFDGWSIPAGKSTVVEAYPSLWKHAYPMNDRTPDQHDAFKVASWLSEADRSEQLARYLQPNLTPPERTVAGVESWILGVG